MRSARIALTVIALGLPAIALAQTTDHSAHHPADAKTTVPAAALAEGEVRRVDKEAGKITLRHGPIANLDMPAMSMVFQVKNSTMLDNVKPGDKVKFSAEKVGGAFILTHVEVTK